LPSETKVVKNIDNVNFKLDIGIGAVCREF
jgi:hypothetical protein